MKKLRSGLWNSLETRIPIVVGVFEIMAAVVMLLVAVLNTLSHRICMLGLSICMPITTRNAMT